MWGKFGEGYQLVILVSECLSILSYCRKIFIEPKTGCVLDICSNPKETQPNRMYIGTLYKRGKIEERAVKMVSRLWGGKTYEDRLLEVVLRHQTDMSMVHGPHSMVWICRWCGEHCKPPLPQSDNSEMETNSYPLTKVIIVPTYN